MTQDVTLACYLTLWERLWQNTKWDGAPNHIKQMCAPRVLT